METQILERMKGVAKAVEELPELLRPAAFKMMKEHILSGAAPTGQANGSSGEDEEDDKEGFFSELEMKRPADGVLAITAYLYKLFGNEPFGLAEIRILADEVGLTIPDRIDMTLKGAKRGGKPLFRSLGHGQYAPTVHGEKALKSEYAVTKGRRSKRASLTEAEGQQ